jgi:hypothetical protein
VAGGNDIILVSAVVAGLIGINGELRDAPTKPLHGREKLV